MIFVTLGSQKFQFDRLLEKLDGLLEQKIITDEVFAQSGYSAYQPRHFKTVDFMDRETFASNMQKADMVITHAGTGAIIGGVKAGKKVIAVPRLARFGEHVDDHQLQIVEQFSEMHIIEPCYDLDMLGKAYQKALETTYTPYKSNTQTIIHSIEEFLTGGRANG